MKRLILILSLLLAACLEMPGAPTLPATPTAAATNTSAPIVTQTASPAPLVCTVETGIQAGALNIRAGVGVKNAVLAVLNEGETVIRTGKRDGRWWEVVTSDQLTGWLNSDYCRERR